MPRFVRSYIHLWLIFVSLNATAQESVADTATHKLVIAGPAYKRPPLFQKLWGSNHRVEWTTPVCVPILKLDTAFEGLIPYKVGGGNESKSLRLHTKEGKEYVLRSINKSRTLVIPPELRGTFLQDIVNDGISMSHPYGAYTLPVMMKHAGLYHTRPKLVYLPQQKTLDTFNKKFANDLYSLEQKPEGDWHEADNLGNFRAFYSTEDVLVKLQISNSYSVDQRAFIKARLFDILIGDWDRHEGNWSWGEVTLHGNTQFKPIPKDRDQSFFYHNGIIINRIIQGSGLNFMQHFDYEVEKPFQLSTAARFMDRLFTNALTLDDWMREAAALQQALTDSVIVHSVAQLPPEVYALKGREIVDKLKARREQIPVFTKQHYLFIAKEVEVVGSNEREYFEVTSEGDETVVAVFRINNHGVKAKTPYYKRRFKPAETKEIRLFGIKGEDVYEVNNNVKDITIRIIGGPGKDSIVQTKQPVHIYDDADNVFHTSGARMHLSSDTSIHNWDYKWFNYNKHGFRPVVFYNNADRVFVGLNYRVIKNKWRHDPFASKNTFGVRYSISQNAMSVFWEGLYPNVIGEWNLAMRADYDAIRWTNFYGTGNETKSLTTNINYYRMQSEEWFATAGLNRLFGKSMVQVTGFYQQVRTMYNSDRYFSKVFSHNDEAFETNPYAGLQLSYSYVRLKDSVVPEKGFTFLANAVYANNFKQNELFQRYNATLNAFFPLVQHVSLVVRLGGETIVNDDVLNSGQPNEHAIIGGPRTLRGYRRERFWGKTAFYNSNELRYIIPFRSYLMTGKIGMLAFFDQGRVWMPGEKSNKMHISYGPGILIAPFNKYNVSVTYGITEEIRLVQLRLNKSF